MQVAASAALAVVLSVMCYGLRLLTKGGCVSAAIVGFAIGGFGGLDWLLLLILFALLGFAATKLGFTRKREMGVQEGGRGERGYRNILGVGIPPAIAAVLCFLFPEHSRVFAMMYIATVSVAAADTPIPVDGDTTGLGTTVPDPPTIVMTPSSPTGTNTPGNSATLVASRPITHTISYLLRLRETVLAGNVAVGDGFVHKSFMLVVPRDDTASRTHFGVAATPAEAPDVDAVSDNLTCP